MNSREPQPAPGAVCPAWLDRVAKAEWKRIAPELERLGLLSLIDQQALAAYCQAYSRLVAAEKEIAAEGITVETETGEIKRHPAVLIAKEAMTLIRLFMAEFGMTPSARSRVQSAGSAGKQDDFEQFMGSKLKVAR